MSRQDVARLAFVISGMYLVLESLTRILDFLAGIQNLSSLQLPVAQFILWNGSPIAVLLVAGIGLFVFSKGLAARFFPDDSPARERILAFPALAYAVVGLVCFCWGFSSVGRQLMVVGFGGWAQAVPAQFGEAAVLIPLGVALFFGSHGLARIWSRLRYAGLRRQMGLCIRCGYDLTGNTTGVCPECGTAQQAPSARELQGK